VQGENLYSLVQSPVRVEHSAAESKHQRLARFDSVTCVTTLSANGVTHHGKSLWPGAEPRSCRA